VLLSWHTLHVHTLPSSLNVVQKLMIELQLAHRNGSPAICCEGIASPLPDRSREEEEGEGDGDGGEQGELCGEFFGETCHDCAFCCKGMRTGELYGVARGDCGGFTGLVTSTYA
jgi:hypothetical protein